MRFTRDRLRTIKAVEHAILGKQRHARRLMARGVNVGIRYFTDYFAVKLPTEKKLANHGGAGSSDWHQDYAASASDRSGGTVFWMTLTDFTSEKGTIAFLNG